MASQTPTSDMKAAISELLETTSRETSMDALAFLLGCLENQGSRDTTVARAVGSAIQNTLKFANDQAKKRTTRASYGMPTMQPVETLSIGDRLHPEKDGKTLPAAAITSITLTPIDKHYRVEITGGTYFVYRPGTQVFSACKH